VENPFETDKFTLYAFNSKVFVTENRQNGGLHDQWMETTSEVASIPEWSRGVSLLFTASGRVDCDCEQDQGDSNQQSGDDDFHN
jgi:hypothetical protein